MNRFFGHLSTVCRHKWFVAKYCFRAGLYWQGITHDLSKFSPTEFLPGVRYFQGDRSPNEIERDTNGYSLVGVRSPPRFVVETFCDRVAASRTYKKEAYTDASPWEYYMHGHDHSNLHPDTERLLLGLLTMLKDEGEDAVFRYIRTEVLKKEARR